MPAYALDKTSLTPLYQQLYQHLREDIESGILKVGARLPSRRRLANDLSVSPATVEAAITQLSVEGYVSPKPRSGYYVNAIETMPQTDSAKIAATGKRTIPANENRSFKKKPRFDLTSNDISNESFPFSQWTRTLRSVMAEEPEELIIGSGDPCGQPVLRNALADFLYDTRGMEVNPDCVVVASGSQVLYNLCVQLLGHQMTIAIEDPGYLRLHSIYRANGVETVPVPLGKNGLSRQGLEECGASLVHVMPSHQFPTGRVMPVNERYELLAWANEDDGRYILEDD